MPNYVYHVIFLYFQAEMDELRRFLIYHVIFLYFQAERDELSSEVAKLRVAAVGSSDKGRILNQPYRL